MSIDLVLVTYNRLAYTRLALASILADPTEEFSLTIWDNASTDDTAEYLRREINDPRIAEIIFSRTNVGQVEAVNTIWSRSKAELLGKLDNDCIVEPGWTRRLAQAHRDIESLGVLACWHYFPDDFEYERARHKIQTFGQHQILRHPWTCGTGLLIKNSTYRQLGPISDSATTEYWFQMAKRGYINGFYYPLVFQEHMDDPKSKHSVLKDEDSYQAAKSVTFNINQPGQDTLADRWIWREEVLANLMDDPWDVRHYVGCRGKILRFKKKLSRYFRRG